MVRQGTIPKVRHPALALPPSLSEDIDASLCVASDIKERLETVLAQLSDSLAELDLLGLTLSAAQLSQVVESIRANLDVVSAEISAEI
jgi:hypothetical protein